MNARAIAKELGSSTMPVYSTIESIENLKELIFARSMEVAAKFRAEYQVGDVLTNYAMGHIMLAKEEQMLFRLVWLDDSWDRSDVVDMLDNNINVIKHELIAEGKYMVANDESFSKFISRVWFIVRGTAVGVNLGSFNIVANDERFDKSMACFIRETIDDVSSSYRKSSYVVT